ncbi:MAG TPA: hypothetical protein P5017_09585 [Anaerohalosphaeraceae bacterium]|nr:hypothetical protein [Anaerohalosphaeraceae bacterium]
MFEDVIRILRNLEKGVKINIEMSIDENGYLDRKCPHNECQQEFKVLLKDWKEKVPDKKAYCPLCGHSDDSGNWNTPDQDKYISDCAENYVMDKFNKAFSTGVKKFNSSQRRNSWISMKMDYKPGSPKVIVPYEAAEVMQQVFCCEKCECKYSSIGASFFCPACGHNSIERDFQLSINGVKKMLDSLEDLEASISRQCGKDLARDTIRQMLETSLGKLTGAFQRLMEALFNKLPEAQHIKQRKNVFQNLNESSDLWNKANCKRYEDMLDSSEWYELNRLFQQRHLLSHCDGIIDQRYIDNTGDTTYSVGQKLIVPKASVLRLVELVDKLGEAKRKEIDRIISSVP